jgi:transposase
MGRQKRYTQELRERAVRMLLESEDRYGSRWEAIRSVAEKLGCSAEDLRSCLHVPMGDVRVLAVLAALGG